MKYTFEVSSIDEMAKLREHLNVLLRDYDKEEKFKDTPVDEIPRIGDYYSLRLKNSGIATLGQIVAATDKDLLKIEWIGKESIQHIRRAVSDYLFTAK